MAKEVKEKWKRIPGYGANYWETKTRVWYNIDMSLCKKCKEGNEVAKNVFASGIEYIMLSCTVNSEGKHHSFSDRPSLVYRSKNKIDKFKIKSWHKNGQLHKLDGPAAIFEKSEYYFLNGEFLKSQFKK